MRRASVTQRMLAVSLAFLVSCSTTRYSTAGPIGPEDLARYALIIRTQADGKVAHEWVPLEDFDMTKFQLAMSPIKTNRDIVCVSTSESELEEYCEGRRIQCEQDCLTSSRPFLVDWRKYTDTKAQPWRVARYWWCPRSCREGKEDCTKKRGKWYEEYSPSFHAIEPAIDWIKEHRTELLVGTVVVIAGVAFAVVVVGSGGGALALAPLMVLAEAGR
ncbi:hypothetical protein [Archangium sp.]|uniref:hypothetical protein n=1 Tax=Archangium sp. TaxID=1872627 RepID=UPI002D27FA6D|nr:hypothetical protein [Archangium sp.]HYO59778.1 hypothetical protein [Archangium sp.]